MGAMGEDHELGPAQDLMHQPGTGERHFTSAEAIGRDFVPVDGDAYQLIRSPTRAYLLNHGFHVISLNRDSPEGGSIMRQNAGSSKSLWLELSVSRDMTVSS